MHRPAAIHIQIDRRPTMNYAQVMEQLGCSKAHVYNLYNRGDLTGFMSGAGRGLRIYVESISRYLQRNPEIE